MSRSFVSAQNPLLMSLGVPLGVLMCVCVCWCAEIKIYKPLSAALRPLLKHLAGTMCGFSKPINLVQNLV